MAYIQQPPRKFRFVVEGVIPSTVQTDDESKLFLVGVRNLILSMIAGAVSAVPTREQLDQIELLPYTGPYNAQGGPIS